MRVGNVLDLSGALGNGPGKAELVTGGIEAEARQTMENIGAVLRENGLSFADVFKCTVMLADMSKWAARVAIDTTVQPKAIAHPTAARLLHRALVKLVELARREGVPLRQSNARVAKRAAIMIGSVRTDPLRQAAQDRNRLAHHPPSRLRRQSAHAQAD